MMMIPNVAKALLGMRFSSLAQALGIPLVVALAANPANAANAAAAPEPALFQVRVRMEQGGKTTFAKVGELERGADGKIAVRGVVAPELEALVDKLDKEWRAYREPKSVDVSEMVASDTGMRPSYKKYTFTFTPKDKLFKLAVIKQFLEQRGYDELGLSTVDFIERDMTAESPAGADDRASQIVNVRKGSGAKLDLDADGGASVIVYAKVRAPTSPGQGRASASRPSLVLATNNDEGKEELGRLVIDKQGKISLVRSSAAKIFEGRFDGIGSNDVEVATYLPDGRWGKIAVPRTSPRLLEGYILWRQSYDFYDVQPPIDPAVLDVR